MVNRKCSMINGRKEEERGSYFLFESWDFNPDVIMKFARSFPSMYIVPFETLSAKVPVVITNFLLISLAAGLKWIISS